MTSPVAHDHPDWARTASTADIEVTEVVAQVQNVLNQVRTTHFVGNSPYIWIDAAVDLGGMRTTILWKDALVGGTTVGVNVVDVRQAMRAVGPMAVLAPYFELQTLIDVVGRQVTVRIWQNYSWGNDYRATMHNAIHSVDAQAIGAGGNASQLSGNVRWGWGYWNFAMEGATFYRCRLYALDYLGNRQFLAYWGNSSVPASSLIILPPRPVEAFIENVDASPRNYWLSLVAHPGPF